MSLLKIRATLKGAVRESLNRFRSKRDEPMSRQLIWDGIYNHYRDVPAFGLGYEGDALARETEVGTRNMLAALCKDEPIAKATTADHSLMPLLASTIYAQQGFVRILDFGGGAGIHFLHLKASLGVNCENIEYRVVETPAMCARGRTLYPEDRRIKFCSGLPEASDPIDVVHLCAVVQYVEDYKGLLNNLCQYGAQYLCFVKLSVVRCQTFASAQCNIPDQRIPYWFVNVDELIAILRDCGYVPIFSGTLEREYDQANFPTTHRMGRASNMVFRRRVK